MKVAVSIPDAVFRRAERLTKRLGKSRSQLYAEALRDYVARHDPDEVTQAMNHVRDALDPTADGSVAAAGRRVLDRTEW